MAKNTIKEEVKVTAVEESDDNEGLFSSDEPEEEAEEEIEEF